MSFRTDLDIFNEKKLKEMKISITDPKVQKVFDYIKNNSIKTTSYEDFDILSGFLDDENIGRHRPVVGGDYYLVNEGNLNVIFNNSYFYSKEPISDPEKLLQGQTINHKGSKTYVYRIDCENEKISNLIGYRTREEINLIKMSAFIQTVEYVEEGKTFGPVKRKILESQSETTGEKKLFVFKTEYDKDGNEITGGTYRMQTKQMYYLDPDLKDKTKCFKTTWANDEDRVGRDLKSGKFVGTTIQEFWEEKIEGKITDGNRKKYFFKYGDKYYIYRNEDESEKYLYDSEEGETFDFFLSSDVSDRKHALSVVKGEENTNDPWTLILYDLSPDRMDNVGNLEGLEFLVFDTESDDTFPPEGKTPIERYKLFNIPDIEEESEDKTDTKTNFKGGEYIFKEESIPSNIYNMTFQRIDIDIKVVYGEEYKKEIKEFTDPFFLVQYTNNGIEIPRIFNFFTQPQYYVFKKVPGEEKYTIHKAFLKNKNSTDLIKKALDSLFQFKYDPNKDEYYVTDFDSVKKISENISEFLKTISFDRTKTGYGNMYNFLHNNSDAPLYINPLPNISIKRELNGYELEYKYDNGFWCELSIEEDITKENQQLIEENQQLSTNKNFYWDSNNKCFIKKKNISSLDNTELSQDSNSFFIINKEKYSYYKDENIEYFYKVDYNNNNILIHPVPDSNDDAIEDSEIKYYIINMKNLNNKYVTVKYIKKENGFFEPETKVESIPNYSFTYNKVNLVGKNKIIYSGDGKKYIMLPQTNNNEITPVTYSLRNTRNIAKKLVFVEVYVLSASDYIEIVDPNTKRFARFNYDSKNNTFIGELEDNYLIDYQDYKKTNNYYRYSQKSKKLYIDYFLKKFDLPLSGYLIFPKIGYRSRIDLLNNREPRFESFLDIDKHYNDVLCPNIYASGATAIEGNFLTLENFPEGYKVYKSSNKKKYNTQIFDSMSKALFKNVSVDFSSNRNHISDGTWCCLNSKRPFIFNNNKDSLVVDVLNGKLNRLTSADIDEFLLLLSANVTMEIERQYAEYRENIKEQLGLSFSDLGRAFIDFKRMWTDVFGDTKFGSYFVNVGSAFKDVGTLVWEILFDDNDSDAIPYGTHIYNIYRSFLKTLANSNIKNIKSVDGIKIIEWVYLLTEFFKEQNENIRFKIDTSAEDNVLDRFRDSQKIIKSFSFDINAKDKNTGTIKIKLNGYDKNININMSKNTEESNTEYETWNNNDEEDNKGISWESEATEILPISNITFIKYKKEKDIPQKAKAHITILINDAKKTFIFKFTNNKGNIWAANANTGDPENPKMTSIILNKYRNLDGNLNGKGDLRISLTLDGVKEAYSINMKKEESSNDNFEYWTTTDADKIFKIKIYNSDDYKAYIEENLTLTSLSEVDGADTITSNYNAYWEEDKSGITIRNFLMYTYDDAAHFRYQYWFMRYQLTLLDKKITDKYIFNKNYNILITDLEEYDILDSEN